MIEKIEISIDPKLLKNKRNIYTIVATFYMMPL